MLEPDPAVRHPEAPIDPGQVAGSLQHPHTEGQLVPNQPNVHVMTVGVRNLPNKSGVIRVMQYVFPLHLEIPCYGSLFYLT